ncbi:hypothetical protein C4580_02380 [Candidatus Woesearchaeota archaeon]|nr:MAG: hypothetical protein C4580_02380 [Candidatus Woesearchaeota archaeon]
MNKTAIAGSILILLLLTGCLQIDIQQKLKRSGKVDLSLTFKSDSTMILENMKEQFQVNPAITRKYTYSETEKSATYQFTDVDPQTDSLFLSQGDEKTAAFMNKDSYKISREFKFPYYYFTYEIHFPVKEQETEQDEFASGMASSLFKITYTVETFGRIIETNGNKMSDNAVKFDISLTKDETHYVVFKDFFLFTWFGSLFSGSPPAPEPRQASKPVQNELKNNRTETSVPPPANRPTLTKEENQVLIQYNEQIQRIKSAKNSMEYSLVSLDVLRTLENVDIEREMQERAEPGRIAIRSTFELEKFIEDNRELLKKGGYNPDYEKQKLIQDRNSLEQEVKKFEQIR